MAAELEYVKWERETCYFVFNDHVPGKVKMHTKRLNIRDWIQIDKTYPGQMRLRKQLIETKLDLVFASNKDEYVEDCKWELFQMVIEHLPKRFPDIFIMHEDAIYNKVFDEFVSTRRDDAEDPLIRLGRLVQEDWIIMQWNETEQDYVLTAAILCFPMGWSLLGKFNKPMASIHAPVKLFMDHMYKKVSDVFRKLPPSTPLWRANWGIYPNLDGPLDLFTPPPGKNVRRVFEGDKTGRTIQLRHEYQTIRKLPKTKCIAFGVRTYQRYLQEFKSFPTSYSENLLRVINDMDENTASYKGAPLWKDATVEYLECVISGRREKKPCHFIKTALENKMTWYISVMTLVGVTLTGFALMKVRSVK